MCKCVVLMRMCECVVLMTMGFNMGMDMLIGLAGAIMARLGIGISKGHHSQSYT